VGQLQCELDHDQDRDCHAKADESVPRFHGTCPLEDGSAASSISLQLLSSSNVGRHRWDVVEVHLRCNLVIWGLIVILCVCRSGQIPDLRIGVIQNNPDLTMLPLAFGIVGRFTSFNDSGHCNGPENQDNQKDDTGTEKRKSPTSPL